MTNLIQNKYNSKLVAENPQCLFPNEQNVDVDEPRLTRRSRTQVTKQTITADGIGYLINFALVGQKANQALSLRG